MAGMRVEIINTDKAGSIDLAQLKAKVRAAICWVNIPDETECGIWIHRLRSSRIDWLV